MSEVAEARLRAAYDGAELGRRTVRLGDPEYEDARTNIVWNGRVPDRFPELIVQPRSAEEVLLAIRQARRDGLQVAVRSGGHSWAASFLRNRSMLLDLSQMQGLSIDADARLAWVEPGLTGDELLAQLEPHGLFFPSGHCLSVGLGGFLLQGGFGWNSRLWGPACCSVREIELVTADGELLQADAHRNADYFWAARGAGPGFFGVVTRFRLALYERPMAARLTTHVYPLEVLGDLVDWLLAIQPEIPRSVECMLFLRRGLAGRAEPGAMIMAPALAEDDDAARRALSFMSACPVRRYALECHDEIPTSVAEMLQASEQHYPAGARFWVDNMWTDAASSELTPALMEIAGTLPPPPSHVMVLLWGPASPVPDMAFSLQSNVYVGLYGVAGDTSGDRECREWSTGHMRRLEPLSAGIQLADENLGLRPAPFAAPANMQRIEELRGRLDPAGVFAGYMG